MYAVIRDRGRQYTVREGDTLDIDLVSASQEGDAGTIEFKEILLVSQDDDVKVGQPTVSGASVTAKVVQGELKGPKIDVVKFRRRKDSKTAIGHRQRYTRIKIEKIAIGG